jgi:signal transduction histidine kinase/ligand-binding sensor domain-containing protein
VVATNWSATKKATFEIHTDLQGRIWASNGQELYQLVKGQAVAVLGDLGPCRVLSYNRAGGWWIATSNQIRLWREGKWEATVNRPEVSTTSIVCAIEDRNGHLWIGTSGWGLFRCDTDGTVLHFSRREGLGSESILSLFEDAYGNLWVGTEAGGLNRLRSRLFKVYGWAQGLSSDMVTTVSEAKDGVLWVGTDIHGLNRLQGNIAKRPDEKANRALNYVTSVLADHRGGIWLGTRSAGVFYAKEGGFSPVNGFGGPDSATHCLFEDSQGRIWLGLQYMTSLLCIRDQTVTALMLPKTMQPADVMTITEDASGTFWFGTDGRGLIRWHEGSFGQFTRETGLGSDLIMSLQPQEDGALWIGTFGGGLTRLKEGRMATCTTRQGLIDDVIAFIVDDGHGQYWFSSNQGIFRTSKKELNQFADGELALIQCVPYGTSDGLPTLECEGGGQPAGCRGHDGRLWFRTIRGLVVVDPTDVATNAVPPVVHIQELLVDGQPGRLAPEEKSSASAPRGESAGREADFALGNLDPSLVEIPAGHRRFEFRYTALDFLAPERLRFRHKLEGVDAEWVGTGGQREASYNRLPHGNYIFRVDACNREGVWSQSGAALAFTVLPYFWQTWWFTSLFLLTFGSAVAWGMGEVLRQRHRRHLKLVERLHLLERERVRVARDIHDDLGGSLTAIGLQGVLAARDAGSLAEAREQLLLITDRTRELGRRLEETVWAVNPKNDSPSHLATYLCHFAKESFKPTQIGCRLDVPADLPEVELTTEVRHNVFLAVKEAITNAVKHSRASEAGLRLKVSDSLMEIEVSDNGRGFVVDASREGGNGLRNMATRMEEIGGEFQVHSVPGEGTTVCLRLPLPHPDAASQFSAPPRDAPLRHGPANPDD